MFLSSSLMHTLCGATSERGTATQMISAWMSAVQPAAQNASYMELHLLCLLLLSSKLRAVDLGQQLVEVAAALLHCK